MTFVLIVVLLGGTTAISHIPGYLDQASCEAAAAAFKAKVTNSIAFCIPGPDSGDEELGNKIEARPR